MQALMQFVREGHGRLVKPELLGLPSNRTSDYLLDDARCELGDLLVQGATTKCRELLLGLYIAGHSVAEICDEVFAPAMHHIGDEWDCGSIEVFHERRACEICVQVLHELRCQLHIDKTAPIALGCSPEGDTYTLPTRIVELTLRQRGWRATSLGSSVPLGSVQKAVHEIKPRMLWLSVSHLDNEDKFIEAYTSLYESIRSRCAVVVGGRALTEPIRRRIRFSSFGDNLRHLESFANSLLSQPKSSDTTTKD